jgi:hypothetical protein
VQYDARCQLGLRVKLIEAGVARHDKQSRRRHSCSVGSVTWLGWGRQGGGATSPVEGSGPAAGQA